MVFILRFAFLLLFFVSRSDEAEARPIRVGEGQRPFNHSCAVGGKIVSLELDYFLWNTLPGSAPNVGLLSCNHSLTQTRKRRQAKAEAAGETPPAGRSAVSVSRPRVSEQ